jgi:hypothetical protein
MILLRNLVAFFHAGPHSALNRPQPTHHPVAVSKMQMSKHGDFNATLRGMILK